MKLLIAYCGYPNEDTKCSGVALRPLLAGTGRMEAYD